MQSIAKRLIILYMKKTNPVRKTKACLSPACPGSRADTAKTLFNEGFNCAQSLLVACGVDLGVTRSTALKIASTFGGGIGKTGETCGAVTGALMVIGLKYGSTNPKDKKTKAKIHRLVNKFIVKFKSCNKKHSTLCRELIEIDTNLSGRTKIVKKKCLEYIKDSAEIIEQII